MPSEVQRVGRALRCSVITGPRHVLLGLELAWEPGPLEWRQLPAAGPCRHGSWDRAALEVAVLEAVATVAQVHGLEPGPVVRCIEYVTDDTPEVNLAARCATIIAESWLRDEARRS